MKRFVYWGYIWLPPLMLGLAIFIQSAFPSVDDVPQWPFFDKVLHFSAYGLLGFLLLRALLTLPGSISLRNFIVFNIIIVSLYGLSDEIHQAFVPSRQASWADWVADVLGGICGTLFFAQLKKVISMRRKKVAAKFL
jgi:VanZ family protein